MKCPFKVGDIVNHHLYRVDGLVIEVPGDDGKKPLKVVFYEGAPAYRYFGSPAQAHGYRESWSILELVKSGDYAPIQQNNK